MSDIITILSSWKEDLSCFILIMKKCLSRNEAYLIWDMEIQMRFEVTQKYFDRFM